MSNPKEWPELYDAFAWYAATPARRHAACVAIAAALKGGVVLETAVAVAGPAVGRSVAPAVGGGSTRARAIQRPLKMPRLVHPATGLRFVVVPGGVVRLGFSAAEAAVFEDAAFLDTPDGERVWAAGELLELQALQEVAPARVWRLAPFLLCESAVSGLEPSADLRLPAEVEWEQAYRGGTTSPFPWGDAIPTEPVEDEHPLGLIGLGWHFEAVDGHWDPDGGGAVMRGGALEGGLVWQRLLSAWRTVWDRTAEPMVRPVISIPFAPPAPSEVAEEALPVWRMAAVLEELLVRMRSPQPEVYEPARAVLWQRVGGASRWTGQGALVLEALLEAALETEVPRRQSILVMAADLVAGRHPAVIGRGLDLADAAVRRVASSPAALAMRGSLLRWSGRLAVLSRDAEAPVRAAWALLMALVPEVAVTQRETYARAARSESDPATLASLMLGWAHAPGVDPATFAPWTLAEDPLVAGFAWLARAVAGAWDEWPEPLLAGLSENALDPDEMPWSYGRLDSVVALVADCREARLSAAVLLDRAGDGPGDGPGDGVGVEAMQGTP